MAILIGGPLAESLDGDPLGIAEADLILGNGGDDKIRGLDGADTLLGGAGRDAIFGGLLNDLILGEEDADTINGDAGNDSALGGAGSDEMLGGDGNDALLGEGDDDVLFGGAGNDLALGGAGNDRLFGEAGNDTLEGGADADFLDGGVGIRDMLAYTRSAGPVDVNLGAFTAVGADATGDSFVGFEDLAGSGFGDRLTGNAGANIIIGGAGSDEIRGLAGNDTIRGDEGRDRLFGGAGSDVFVYYDLLDSPVGGFDTILDFLQGADLINLAGIDNTVVPLTLIGHNVAYTGSAGDLRSVDNGVDTRLQIDANGDTATDFEILFPGVIIVFGAADLVL